MKRTAFPVPYEADLRAIRDGHRRDANAFRHRDHRDRHDGDGEEIVQVAEADRDHDRLPFAEVA